MNWARTIVIWLTASVHTIFGYTAILGTQFEMNKDLLAISWIVFIIGILTMMGILMGIMARHWNDGIQTPNKTT